LRCVINPHGQVVSQLPRLNFGVVPYSPLSRCPMVSWSSFTLSPQSFFHSVLEMVVNVFKELVLECDHAFLMLPPVG
jgi:hypothetical protein